MFRTIEPAEKFLKKFPVIWKWMDRHRVSPAVVAKHRSNHVVVIGYGRVGRHIVNVLGELNVPCVVVEADTARVEELDAKGVATLYGDAANSEVLDHAGLDDARLLVITIPEDAATEIIVAAAKKISSALPIIARASSSSAIKLLVGLGAQQVIHPELEGGLQIVRRTLLQLGFSINKVQEYADAVRSDYYDVNINTEQERQLLQDLLSASENIVLTWIQLGSNHSLIGQTLTQVNLRASTGASIVAILRGRDLIANPEPGTVLQTNDLLALVGDEGQLSAAQELLVPSSDGGKQSAI
jgi:CPA2 family monovalent cation:H+ antiporter-2